VSSRSSKESSSLTIVALASPFQPYSIFTTNTCSSRHVTTLKMRFPIADICHTEHWRSTIFRGEAAADMEQFQGHEFDYLDSATQLNQIDDLSHAPYSSPSTTNFRSVKEPLLLCTARPRYQATYTTWHRPQRPSPNSNPDERAGHPTLACRLTDRTKPRGDNAYNSQTKGLSIRHPSPLQG
jgi:hypothetical protein